MTKNNAAKAVWKALAFQYKPLEARFLKDLKTAKLDNVLKQYKEGGFAVQIQMLDKYASFLGL